MKYSALIELARETGATIYFNKKEYLLNECTTGEELKRLKTKCGIINWAVNNNIEIKEVSE